MVENLMDWQSDTAYEKDKSTIGIFLLYAMDQS